jgi:hypothetical protein
MREIQHKDLGHQILMKVSYMHTNLCGLLRPHQHAHRPAFHLRNRLYYSHVVNRLEKLHQNLVSKVPMLQREEGQRDASERVRIR